VSHGRHFALVVFDLDGTLVDSRRDIADAANAVVVGTGADPLPIESIARMVGDGAETLVSRVFAAAGRAEPPGALARFLECYDACLLVHTRPYAGMNHVLAELGAQASLAVLTNKPLEQTRRILAGLDLAVHFAEEAIVAADGAFPLKPDPSGLRYLMARVGACSDNTILVGDSVIDWQTASNAGIAVCLARYGFGFDSFPADRLGPESPVADSPLRLLDILQ
jgi:phosphoglycolate phosphatase